MNEPEKIFIIIGNRIRSYRRNKNLTQEQLAEKTGLHHTYIGIIERGERTTTLANIIKIVDALEISLEELFKNIKKNDSQKSCIPSECYEMIMNLSNAEQAAIFEILKKIIDYREF